MNESNLKINAVIYYFTSFIAIASSSGWAKFKQFIDARHLQLVTAFLILLVKFGRSEFFKLNEFYGLWHFHIKVLGLFKMKMSQILGMSDLGGVKRKPCACCVPCCYKCKKGARKVRRRIRRFWRQCWPLRKVRKAWRRFK